MAAHDPEFESLGDRLSAAARGLLESAGCRTAHELCERTRGDGTTARRIVRLAGERASGSVALTRSPSPAHLQRLANQASTRGVDPGACRELRDAAAAFSDLLKVRGIRRAELSRAIRGGLADEMGGED